MVRRSANRGLLRRVGAEAQEAGVWVQWLSAQHPSAAAYLTHIPNQRAGKLDRIILAQLGVRAGVSDYLLALPQGGFHGMWLEFKALGESPSAVSVVQAEWLARMMSAGYFAAAAFGVDDAIEITRAYLGGAVCPGHWFDSRARGVARREHVRTVAPSRQRGGA